MNKFCMVRRQNVPFTFRKWGRKSFSVFQSLNKVIRIGSLSVSYLLFAIPANAEKNMIIAPHDSINPVKGYEIEGVVVSAQRAPVTFSQVARILTVIEKNEIEHAPIQTIQDLLEYALGVDLRQRGGLGVQADVSIRGSSFDQVLILLNGVNICDPQTGHHNLNLPVSLEAVERIEILEGPASRVYGINAFSGAINIITGTNSNTNIKASASGGQFGYFDAGLSGNLASSKMLNFISADHRRSDGYIKNTDFSLTDLYYLGKIPSSSGLLELQAGYSTRGFGANSFYTPVYPNQYENTATSFTSVKMETGKKFHIIPSVYWRRNQDRFELFRDNVQAPAWYQDHNYHLTNVYGINLNTWFSSKLGKTSVGSDFRSENILSTVLGKPLFNPKPVPGEKGKEFKFSDSRTNYSLFLEHSFYMKHFTLSAGVMADRNSHLGNKWIIYPGADLSLELLKSFRIYGSVNKSLRMPTFTDLYYSSPTNTGNPLLKPEEAVAYETGIKYNKPGIISHISYFHRKGNNIIDWVQKKGETVWRAENLTQINTGGLEFYFKAIPKEALFKKLVIKSINLYWSWLDQGKESGEFLSKYVLDYLKNKLSLGMDHALFNKTGASWEFMYQDRNGTFTKWEGSSYGAEVPYPGVWLISSRLYWQNRSTILFLETSNLLNSKYVDYSNVTQPGRWIKFGIKKQFNIR